MKQSKFTLLIAFIIVFSFFACGCGSDSDDHYQTFYPWWIAQNGGGGQPGPAPAPAPGPSGKAKLELSRISFTIEAGSTGVISVTLNGEDVTGSATFTVDDESVATVEDGVITAVGPGTATVTVHVDGAEDAIFTITVTEPGVPTLVVSQDLFEIEFGSTDNVKVTLDETDVTNAVTYTVANTDVVTSVVDGLIATPPVAYSERMETTVTVHLDGANDAIFIVAVTVDLSGSVQDKNLSAWENTLTELYAIGQVASDNIDNLSELKIPGFYRNADGVLCRIRGIGWDYLANRRGLISVTIPATIQDWGHGLYGCEGLESVTLINGISSIPWQAFSGCKALTSVAIPDSVTGTGTDVFYGCEALGTVTFPKNAEFSKIETNVFYGCHALNGITIPESVTIIGSNSFYDCQNLDVTVPNTVTTVEGNAFSGAANVNYSEDGPVTGAPWGAKNLNGNPVM